MIEQLQAQNALLLLAESAVTPTDSMGFIQESVKKLAQLYGADVALIGLFSDDDKSSIKTLAAWIDGDFVENYIYDLEHVPCNDVIRGTINHIPEGLAQRYSQCAAICEMGLQSYYGYRLIGSHGSVIGVIAVLDRKPMELNRWSRPVLSIFANRLSAELERKNIAAELLLSAKVFEESAEGIIITDADGSILKVNQGLTRITNYSMDNLVGEQVWNLRSGLHSASFYHKLLFSLRKNDSWQGEVWGIRKDGQKIYLWAMISNIKDEHDKVCNYIIVLTDITEKKKAEDKIYQLAHYDTLTSLPNRVLFHERLKQELAHADRNKKFLALLYVDLNRFKPVNDTLGHPIGDKVLSEVAQRLLKRVRGCDTVARMGGDEFTLLLSDMENEQSSIATVSRIAQTVLDDLAKPFQFNNHEIIISAGIGIAIYPSGSECIETLIQHADTAMYHAKKQGEGAYLFYEQRMNIRNKERLQMEAELHKALESGELRTFFQPVVSLSNEKITGVEALVRWQHPRHGLIAPAKFIEIAEYSGLIISIGEWVLKQACLQAVVWQQEQGENIYVSVNLSLRQVRNNKLIGSLKSILQETGIDPKYLRLEITESTFIDNMDETIKVLEELRMMGIALAIDDFGTGYSSLAHLKRLPFSALKIDRSFVQDVTVDEEDAAIVSAIIAMSQRLHLATIAEGVETQEQVEFLRNEGCDMIQGFYYGKPMSASDFSKLLVEQKRSHT